MAIYGQLRIYFGVRCRFFIVAPTNRTTIYGGVLKMGRDFRADNLASRKFHLPFLFLTDRFGDYDIHIK